MTATSPDIDEILSRVEYDAARLPHPFELLTADLIAERSGIAKTTFLSAAASLEALRSEAFAEAIGRLETHPSETTWDVLRLPTTSHDPLATLTRLLQARSSEVAQDPAFPLLLSGFDHLDVPAIASAVSTATSNLVDHLVPFVDTVLATNGELARVTSTSGRLIILQCVLAEALRRTLESGTQHREVDRRIAANAAAVMLDEIRSCSSAEPTPRTAAEAQLCHRRPDGVLGEAIHSAATLLLTHSLPVRFGLKLDNVLRATKISSATFYRKFGSIADFERRLVERTGRALVDGFRDEFFDGLLQTVADGTREPGDALIEFQARAAEQMRRHIDHGRPGLELLPWLGSDLGHDVLVPAYQGAFAERGTFYIDFAAMLGLSLATGLDGADIAGSLYAHSVVAEALVRSSPDRHWSMSVVQSKIPLVQAGLFEF